jgi:hypothetical protein
MLLPSQDFKVQSECIEAWAVFESSRFTLAPVMDATRVAYRFGVQLNDKTFALLHGRAWLIEFSQGANRRGF